MAPLVDPLQLPPRVTSSRRPNSLIDHPPKLPLAFTLLQKHLVLDIQQLLDTFIRTGSDNLARLAHPVHDAPQILGATVWICTRRLRPQHGRAVTHRSMHVPRDQNGHVTSRRDQLHQDLILALAATHEDAGYFVAGVVHRRNNLPRLQRDELHCPVIIQRQPIQTFVAAQSDHAAAHCGIRDRAPVTEEIAVEEKVAAKVTYARCRPLLLQI